MPINLKSLQAKGTTIEVEYLDQTAEVNYDPTQFSPTLRQNYLAERRQEAKDLLAVDTAESSENSAEAPKKELDVRDMFRANARLIEHVVKHWDIFALDGKKLAVEVDAILDNLPGPLINHIAGEIWSDATTLGKLRKSEPGLPVTES